MNVRIGKRFGWNSVGLAVFVMSVFPVFWMISTAFKPDDQINSVTPTWFPSHPTLRHFRDALDRPYFWTDVKNSLIVVIVTVVVAIALALFAAIALSKYRFTGRKLFIVARDDANGDGLRATQDSCEPREASSPKELLILDGSAHAQFLFATDQRDRLLHEILRFLAQP